MSEVVFNQPVYVRPGINLFNRANQVFIPKKRISHKVLAQYDEKRSRYELNLKRLALIATLEDDWNTYGAKKFTKQVIGNALEVLRVVPKQPQMIAPTGRATIQFDYKDKGKDRYLEIEIGEGTIGFYYEGFESVYPEEFDICLDKGIQIARELIKCFYE